MTDEPLDEARVDLARFLNSESVVDVRRADDGTPTFTGALWNDLNRAPWPPTDDAEESTWWARLISDVPTHSYAWWVRLLHLIAVEGTPAFDPADVYRAFNSDIKPLDLDEQSQT
jgi:hypothetical protein